MSKQYATRYPEELGQHYMTHVSAMTREGLHDKSDIAAELAFRDAEIERLRRERDELAARCERLQEKLEHFLFLEDGMDESTRPEVVAAARSVASETPATSLAHVRAEAIESAVKKHSVAGKSECDLYVDPLDLIEEADRIRQSAAEAGGDK